MFNKAKIIFTGLTTSTTPKIALIQNSLQKLGLDTEIIAILKYPEHKANQTNFVINQKKTTLKILAGTTQTLRATIYLAGRIDRNSILYAINPPSGLLALILNKIKGTPYLYETHEIFCGFNNDVYGGWKRHLWHRVEKLIIKNSAYFIATDEFRLKFLKRYYRIKESTPSFYLYNTTSIHTINNQESESKKREGTVSYCGGIYPDRMIDTIIKAFNNSKRAKRLVLAGTYDATYKKELDQLIEKLQLQDRVEFTGSIDNASIKSIMTQSELTIAIYSRDCTNNRLCSPNKFFDAIATKTHIITTDSPLARRLLVNNQLGDICNPIDECTLSHKIDQALDRHKNLPEQSSRDLGVSYLWDTESVKLIKAINNISA